MTRPRRAAAIVAPPLLWPREPPRCIMCGGAPMACLRCGHGVPPGSDLHEEYAARLALQIHLALERAAALEAQLARRRERGTAP